MDKKIHHAVGTIELFHRKSDDSFNGCGLLRLDLRSDYEHSAAIQEILRLILSPAFELFDCQIIATKIPAFAAERKAAAEALHFEYTEKKIIGGHDGKAYGDYYILRNEVK